MILFLIYCLDCFADGYDFVGGDMADKITTTRDANNCQRDCMNNNLCNYWTYDTYKTEKNCYLKKELYKASANKRYQSGPRNCLKIEDADKEQQEVNIIKTHTHTHFLIHISFVHFRWTT